MTPALLFKLAHRSATLWALRLLKAGALTRNHAVPVESGMRYYRKAERTAGRFNRHMRSLEALTTKGGAKR